MTAVTANIKLELPKASHKEDLHFGFYSIEPQETNLFAIAKELKDENSQDFIPGFLTPEGRYCEEGNKGTRYLRDCILLFNSYEEAVDRINNIRITQALNENEFIVYQVQSEHYSIKATMKPVKVFTSKI